MGQARTGVRDAEGEGPYVTQNKVASPTLSSVGTTKGKGRARKKGVSGQDPTVQGSSGLAARGFGVSMAKASTGKRVVFQGRAQKDVCVHREGWWAGVVAGLLEVTWGLWPWGLQEG